MIVLGARVRGMRQWPWLACTLCLCIAATRLTVAAPTTAIPRHKTQTVVLIVSDGLRWQEIFTGAEADLLNDKAGGSWLDAQELKKRYWADDPQERRARLFPFLWGRVAKAGQIFGNRAAAGELDLGFELLGKPELLDALGSMRTAAAT